MVSCSKHISNPVRLEETELLAAAEGCVGVGGSRAVTAAIPLECGHHRVVGGPTEPQPRPGLLWYTW